MAAARRRLAHFLIRLIQPHDARAHRRQLRRGHHERFAVQRIESLRDVARQLQMLRLIVAHRHDRGLVQQNIGGHQHRVLQQPVADCLLALRLGLVLRHALQPSDRGHARQHPRELGVRRNRRLHHQRRMLRIDADREQHARQLLDLRPQLTGLLVKRDRVQVYDAIDAIVVVLDFGPVLQRPEIIADVRAAGGLNAGEDSCFHAMLGENSILNDVQIEKWVYGGDALARIEGRVVLVPFVLPGEKARIDARENDVHADLIEVLEPAPERVPAPCPHFARCGGCHYQHAPYEFQVARKVDILREQLRRVGKIDYQGEIETVTGPPLGYRNRAQFHIVDGRIGYLAARSHELVALPGDCPISSPRLNQALAMIRERLSDPRFPRFVHSIELFTNEKDVQINVIETDRPVARSFYDWCESTVALEYPTSIGTFRVSPRAFFQVNRFLIEPLVEKALGTSTGETALDLYAGVGLFALPLAKRFRSVVAVESGSSAARDLEVNAERAGVRITTELSRVEDYLTKLQKPPDFVLADPPRAGLGKTVVSHLNRLAPPRLTIVSCDPATLARDLAALSKYKIERLTLVDLFPQTYHMETVAELANTRESYSR